MAPVAPMVSVKIDHSDIDIYPQVAISSSPACCSKLVDKASKISLDTNRATSLKEIRVRNTEYRI